MGDGMDMKGMRVLYRMAAEPHTRSMGCGDRMYALRHTIGGVDSVKYDHLGCCSMVVAPPQHPYEYCKCMES